MTVANVANITEKAEEIKEQVDLDKLQDYNMHGDWCLVAPIVFKGKKDVHGIVDPQQYEDKNNYGVVVSIGPGRMTDSGVLVNSGNQVGDAILYGKYAYSDLRIKGVDLYLIRQDDIMATLPMKA